MFLVVFPVIGGCVEVDRCTSMVVLHFGQLSVLTLVQIFLVVTQCHSFLGLLALIFGQGINLGDLSFTKIGPLLILMVFVKPFTI
jgi:hypothetical protein